MNAQLDAEKAKRISEKILKCGGEADPRIFAIALTLALDAVIKVGWGFKERPGAIKNCVSALEMLQSTDVQ